MLHFHDNPACATLKLDPTPLISSVQSLDWYRSWQRSQPDKYCAECATNSRTDTDRYAELRALVEAWQTARSASERDRASIPPAVSSVTANPTGQPEGWLARFMDTCAAETLLADWSHR